MLTKEIAFQFSINFTARQTKFKREKLENLKRLNRASYILLNSKSSSSQLTKYTRFS